MENLKKIGWFGIIYTIDQIAIIIYWQYLRIFSGDTAQSHRKLSWNINKKYKNIVFDRHKYSIEISIIKKCFQIKFSLTSWIVRSHFSPYFLSTFLIWRWTPQRPGEHQTYLNIWQKKQIYRESINHFRTNTISHCRFSDASNPKNTRTICVILCFTQWNDKNNHSYSCLHSIVIIQCGMIYIDTWFISYGL